LHHFNKTGTNAKVDRGGINLMNGSVLKFFDTNNSEKFEKKTKKSLTAGTRGFTLFHNMNTYTYTKKFERKTGSGKI
jgi:hypothetical protein